MMLWVLILGLIVNQCKFINCELISYENDYIIGQHPVYLSIPKYAPKDVASMKPGYGKSFVDFSGVSMELDCDPGEAGCVDTLLEILIFQAPDDKYWMDYWPDRTICCSAKLAAEGKCGLNTKGVGRIIIPSDRHISQTSDLGSVTIPPGEIVHFGDDDLSLSTLRIKSTGLYVMVMATCSDKAADIALHGYAESMDPYGYLPADMWGNVSFFSIIAIAYAILNIVWSTLCYNHREELLPIQLHISGVFVLGMLETIFMYMHYSEWNQLGQQLYMLAAVGFLCGVAKRTMSRVLVLITSMGYGVTKVTLGEDWQKIIFLALMYGSLSLVYTFVKVLPNGAKSGVREQKDAIAIVVLLLAITDATFYMWTISSLNTVIAGLRARKQNLKLNLFIRFRAALVTSLFLSVLWIVYAASFIVNDPANHNWQWEWSKEGFLEITYLAVLCVIAFLWAPSKNSQRYAHSIELTQMDDDEYELGPSDDSDPLDAEYLGDLENDDAIFNVSGLDHTAATKKV
jgi:hypothetical protein